MKKIFLRAVVLLLVLSLALSAFASCEEIGKQDNDTQSEKEETPNSEKTPDEESESDESASDESASDESASDESASDESASDESESDESESDESESDEGASDDTTPDDETTSDDTTSDDTTSDDTTSDDTTSDDNTSDDEGASDDNTSDDDNEIGTEGLAYTLLDDDTYEVSVGSAKEATEIVIPSKYNGKLVTSIGDAAFYECTGLTSIDIPDSVKSIGDYAFMYCIGLTSVTIGNGVESIGYSAFSRCDELTSINYCGSEAEWNAIEKDDNWNKNVPEDCQIIFDNYADSDDTGSDETKYSEGLSYEKHASEEGYIVTGLGTCTDTDIVIPSTYEGLPVIGIGDSAFYDCIELTSIDIPDSVKSIGAWAFADCTGLTSVTIGNGVESIGMYAFSSCTGLTSIDIPDSVKSIGDFAFNGCTGLTSITVAEGNTKYHSAGNCLIETASKTLILGCKNSVIPADGSVTSIGAFAFYDCNRLTSIDIPDNVTIIGARAFYNCTGLTSITIGNGVESIGSYAFYECTGLTSIDIPDSVTSIGNDAFSGCYRLTSVTIGNGVESIGNCAFQNCTGLTSIDIPDSVKSMGHGAFEDCDGLTSITIPFVGATLDGTSDTSFGYIFGAYSYSDSYSDNGNYIPTSLKTVVVTGGTSIGSYAFYGCSGLTSIEIPNSVTSIGYEVFSGCSELTSIDIPDSVTSIGSYAFRICTGLTSIDIPNTVTSIGSYAFENCDGLTSVTIGNGVERIGYGVFRNCTGLTSIKFRGTEAEWNAIEKGEYWRYNVPASCRVICDSEGLIYEKHESEEGYIVTGLGTCTDTDIVIPSTYEGLPVIGIGYEAFKNCTGLTSIDIPDSVTSIGNSAFAGTAYYNNESNWENGVLYIGKVSYKGKE